MKKIAIIPLRAGSKGIPGKNKKKLLGRPLYQWVLGEAIFSELDEIYVLTDDAEILEQIQQEYTWTNKVKGMLRSPESATDTASTEQAMLELANNLNNNFDVICLLQATSPLTNADNINNCLAKIKDENFDSVLTIVETKRFTWSQKGESLNYDYLNRPRRQNFDGLLIENGAVYAAKKETFLENKNRLGGEIGIVKMPEDTLTEIDEITDWVIIEKLIQNRLTLLKKPVSEIKAMVFDVDGVFTDGTVAVSSDTELFKQFSVRDGMGFEILRQSGITPIVLTSEDSPIVKTRMDKLKIEHLYLGVKDKYSRLQIILNNLKLTRNELAYLGDDINDLPNILSAAWGIAPANALPSIKQNADLTLNNPGGNLAIRESIEFIEKYNQKF
ncbi:MAG: acylneuraminate cytidylyltransferase [Melioribacteraceae bacterium]|jgi:YrbI family 3-deoxy-D-manno-octulosonate 8-phosphate phosphatase|nr:acylneuraminate cytidylyltransferase [Melioribacteraceae bacterium]